MVAFLDGFPFPLLIVITVMKITRNALLSPEMPSEHERNTAGIL